MFDAINCKAVYSQLFVCTQTGSWFELANKNPIFGVLGPSNPLWSIILGFFGVSGYPTAGESPTLIHQKGGWQLLSAATSASTLFWLQGICFTDQCNQQIRPQNGQIEQMVIDAQSDVRKSLSKEILLASHTTLPLIGTRCSKEYLRDCSVKLLSQTATRHIQYHK